MDAPPGSLPPARRRPGAAWTASLVVLLAATVIAVVSVEEWDFTVYRPEDNTELDGWTLVFGVTAVAGTVVLAWWYRSGALALMAAVWLVVVINDALAVGLHGRIADRVRGSGPVDVLSDLLPGNTANVPEFVGAVVLAVPVAVLVLLAVRRARPPARGVVLVLTGLLVPLFVFSAGFDVVDGLLDGRYELGTLEELGECLTMAGALAVVVHRVVAIWPGAPARDPRSPGPGRAEVTRAAGTPDPR